MEPEATSPRPVLLAVIAAVSLAVNFVLFGLIVWLIELLWTDIPADTFDGSARQQGSVMVYAAGMDNAGLHVATTRHKNNMTIYAARDQVEDIRTYIKDNHMSDAERLQRVNQSLADLAARTADNRNDTAVSDDLGVNPKTQIDQLGEEEKQRAWEELQAHKQHHRQNPKH